MLSQSLAKESRQKNSVVQSPTLSAASHPQEHFESNASESAAADIPRQPAVWVDLGEASQLTPDQQNEIQELAETLHQRISDAGLDPDSPEYLQLWNDATDDSDFAFRQRYGDQAWMLHHVQAYHLARAAKEQGK